MGIIPFPGFGWLKTVTHFSRSAQLTTEKKCLPGNNGFDWLVDWTIPVKHSFAAQPGSDWWLKKGMYSWNNNEDDGSPYKTWRFLTFLIILPVSLEWWMWILQKLFARKWLIWLLQSPNNFSRPAQLTTEKNCLPGNDGFDCVSHQTISLGRLRRIVCLGMMDLTV